jgi:hypothetical protein
VESCPVSDCEWFSADSIDLNCFHCSDDQCHPTQSEIHSDFVIPHPFTTGILKNALLDPLGVCQVHQMQLDHGRNGNDTAYELNLCSSCSNSVKKHKLPALALANHTALGIVPSELPDLMFIEESMIALYRAKCWIVQLSEQDSNLNFPQTQ